MEHYQRLEHENAKLRAALDECLLANNAKEMHILARQQENATLRTALGRFAKAIVEGDEAFSSEDWEALLKEAEAIANEQDK